MHDEASSCETEQRSLYAWHHLHSHTHSLTCHLKLTTRELVSEELESRQHQDCEHTHLQRERRQLL